MLPLGSSSPWSEWRGDREHLSSEDGRTPSRGEAIWSQITGDQVLSSPVFYKGGLLIGSDDGWLYCMDPLDGAVIWKFRTNSSVQATALVLGDRAYFGSFDGHLYCIELPEKGSGNQPKLVWRYDCEGQIISSAHELDGSIYTADLEGYVHRVTLAGEKVWSVKITDREIWATPLLDAERGVLYIGETGRNLYRLRLSDGNVTGTISFPEEAEIYSSGTKAGSMLYVCTGLDRSLAAIDLATWEVRWRFWSGYPCYSTPNVKGERIYFGTFEWTWCIPLEDPDGDGAISEDEVVWSSHTYDFQGGSSPLVAGGKVFIGSDNWRLYCFNATNGRELWNFSTNGYIYSSPSLYDGKVYFGSSDRSVYCIGKRPPGITINLSLSHNEITSDNTTTLDMVLLDGTGRPVEGARVEIVVSAGELRGPEGGIPPKELLTDNDGRLILVYVPPLVSSRSTMEVTIKASKQGLLPSLVYATVIVEPGNKLPQDTSGPVHDNAERMLYLTGMIGVVVLNLLLLIGILLLSGKRRRSHGGGAL